MDIEGIFEKLVHSARIRSLSKNLKIVDEKCLKCNCYPFLLAMMAKQIDLINI